MPTIACPTADDLAAYCLGDLSAERLDAVADHLDTCPDCSSRLSGAVRGSDPLADAVRNAGGVQAYAAPPTTLRDYRIEGVIGEGGMGTVYRAVHSRLNRPVALKLLTARRRLDPAAAARFEREMRAIGALKHPHIVQATDAGEADGVPFLVMELLDGDDLGHVVQANGPLSVSAACDAVRQAALGLQHAHDHGLVHRDVKPSNLMRTADGTVKILDLGLARATADDRGESGATTRVAGRNDLTDPDTKLGTERYMAPEQRTRPDTVGPAADVFALGRTLCFLLTGSPDLPAAGSVPARLHALLERMQGPTPETRIASAGGVARALEPWCGTSRPNRTIAWAAGGAVAVAAAIGLTWYAMNRGGAGTAASAIDDDAPPVPAVEVDPPLARELGMSPEEAVQSQREWAAFLGVEAFVTREDGLRLALVPPGTLRLSDATSVRISRPYYVGVTEVTVGQFRDFVQRTGHRTAAESLRNGKYWYVDRTGGKLGGTKGKLGRDLIWKTPGYPTSEDRPVSMVSWHDAVAFCDDLSARDGKRYRLPTAAEAVWASRAGHAAHFPGGTVERNYAHALKEHAVTVSVSSTQPLPVGSLRANAWGLHDTVGNVAEWTVDWRSGAAPPPGLLVDYAGPPSGTLRVTSGGSYTNELGYGAFIGESSDGATSITGFRVVREP